MTQPRTEREEEVEAWRDLEAVLEELDRERWAEQHLDDDAPE